MARTQTKWIYTFDELDERAKEKARQWWREGAEFDGEPVSDWLAEVCEALSIDLDSRKVYWRGFWSQGDGSSYAGRVNAWSLLRAVESNALAMVAPGLILPDAPALNHLVRWMLENQSAIVTAACGESGGYGGEFNLHTDSDIDCYGLDDRRHSRIYSQLHDLGEWAESVLDAINDWFYRALETDYKYQNSDEQVDEMLSINGYEFDIDGNRA